MHGGRSVQKSSDFLFKIMRLTDCIENITRVRCIGVNRNLLWLLYSNAAVVQLLYMRNITIIVKYNQQPHVFIFSRGLHTIYLPQYTPYGIPIINVMIICHVGVVTASSYLKVSATTYLPIRS